MSIQIKLKNSVVQDSTPSTSDLPAVGEIALNANINSIGGFMRASDNTIVKIFGPGSLSTPTATTTVSGISELATNTETTTGTATNRVVTPAGLNAVTVAERTTSNNNYVAKAGSTLTGVLTMPNGSNSAPAINFGDSDSGIFGGTNTVSLAAGGATRLTVDTGVSVVGTLAVTGSITATSNLTIGDKIIHAGDTNTAIRFPAADTVSIETNGSEAIRVDSSRRLLVGTSTARSPQGISANFQIEGTGVNESSMSLTRNSADNGSATLIFNKSRGAAVGSDVVVQNNDILGFIYFAGNDGTDSNNSAASISAFVDGTPGANDMPGRLVFSTTTDGAASPTDRLTIDSTGLSTFSGNVSFGDNDITNVGTIALDTIKGDADDNTNINFAGSDIVNIKPAGTTRLSVNTSGVVVTGGITGSGDLTIDTNTLRVDSTNNRVGIGLTNPAVKLHISGTSGLYTRFQNTSAGNNVNFGQSAGDGVIDVGGSFGLRILTNGSDRVKVDSSGRLLLGTTTEGHVNADNLTVAGSGDTGITIRSGTADAGSLFFSDATSGNAEFAGFLQYLHNNNSLNIGTDETTRMTINNSGAVGIGTTSPGNKLHVEGAAGSGAYLTKLFNTIGSGDVAGHVLFLDANRSDTTNTRLIDSKDNKFTVFSNGAANFAGDVGINRTSPTAKLHIVESTSIPAVKIKQGLNSNQNAALQFFNDNGTGTLSLGVFGSAATTFGANEASDGFITANNQLSINAQNSSGQIRFGIGSTPNEKMRIDSTGRVGIGTTNIGSHQLVVQGGKAETGGSSLALKTGEGVSDINSALALYGTFVSPTSDQGTRRTADIISGFAQANWGTEFLSFNVGKSGASNDTQQVCDERMRITGAGDLVINSTTARTYNGHTPRLSVQGTNFSESTFAISSNSNDNNGAYLFLAKQRSGSVGGNTVVANGDLVGQFRYLAGDGTDVNSEVANISVNIDGTPGSNDTPGRITFATTNDGGNVSTERMRISQSGQVLIGTTTNNSSNYRSIISGDGTPSYFANGAGLLVATTNSNDANCVEFFQGRFNKRVLTESHANTGGVSFTVFEQADNSVGSITGNGSNVAFNTSSDYRLKENIVTLTDAITRLKQLIPRRFNWIADSTNTLEDGFIAHEVSPVIPEAVTGEKDALEEDGSIDPQGMDYGKLTPLLTAALQEAIAKIEILETKVAALEAA